MSVTTEELKVICDMTVKLVELRQNECKHLCIENIAAECFGKLLLEYSLYSEGKDHVEQL